MDVKEYAYYNVDHELQMEKTNGLFVLIHVTI